MTFPEYYLNDIYTFFFFINVIFCTILFNIVIFIPADGRHKGSMPQIPTKTYTVSTIQISIPRITRHITVIF